MTWISRHSWKRVTKNHLAQQDHVPCSEGFWRSNLSLCYETLANCKCFNVSVFLRSWPTGIAKTPPPLPWHWALGSFFLYLSSFYSFSCRFETNGCFLKWWYLQNTPTWSFLVGKPMAVWYHHFRKPPNIINSCLVFFLSKTLLGEWSLMFRWNPWNFSTLTTCTWGMVNFPWPVDSGATLEWLTTIALPIFYYAH